MRPELAGEWMQKLQRYTEASEMVIRPNPKKSSEPTVAMQAEGEKVLKALRPQVSFLLFCPASHLISTFFSCHLKNYQPRMASRMGFLFMLV